MHTVSTTQEVTVRFDAESIELREHTEYAIELSLRSLVQNKYPHFVVRSTSELITYVIQYCTESDSTMNEQLKEAAQYLVEEGTKRGLKLK